MGATSTAHRPRKRFGQHFLVDVGVLDAIVRAIAPQPDDKIVEIGPGLGALTGALLERIAHLTVIELDRDLAVRLRADRRLDVIEADVLQVDFATVAAGAPALRIVGNLPYNISSPILFHLLPVAERVQDQHFMLQQEVVDRMLAPADSSAYGRLSVMLQWRYAMERVLDVGPEAFDPPPRVWSAVVRMSPRPGPQCADVDAALLADLVRVAFSQRRKLLRHTLGPWLASRAYDGIFDLGRRAQEVPVADFLRLARQLQAAASQ